MTDYKNLKPFDTFTKILPASLSLFPHGKNGYVVIPEEFPNDYDNKFYEQIDTSPVTELTFGGWVDSDGFLYWDEPEDKTDYKKVIGFDDAHAFPNEMSAEEGAKYIANQLKKIYEQKQKQGEDMTDYKNLKPFDNFIKLGEKSNKTKCGYIVIPSDLTNDIDHMFYRLVDASAVSNLDFGGWVDDKGNLYSADSESLESKNNLKKVVGFTRGESGIISAEEAVVYIAAQIKDAYENLYLKQITSNPNKTNPYNQNYKKLTDFVHTLIKTASAADENLDWNSTTLKYLGFGIRVYSERIRDGIKIILDLQEENIRLRDRVKLFEEHKDEKTEFLEFIFEDDIDFMEQLDKSEKSRIRDVIDRIREEQEERYYYE